jgi:hypothetical protein
MIPTHNPLRNDGASLLPLDERVQILQDEQAVDVVFRRLPKSRAEDVSIFRRKPQQQQR